MELNRGGELALVQIDISAAFDRVNHGGLVFKLWKTGIVGGLILKVFQYFLSSRTQRVKVDGVCSLSIDVVSGVPQGSKLGPLLFLLYISDLPRLLQNELVGYADDSALLCRIPYPRDRLPVTASLNDDMSVISDWCSRYRLYAAAKARYCADCRRNLDDCASANAWWRTLKGHVFGGILRKTMSVYRDVTVVAKCFWAFILPVLEYCSPVWMSAATSHLSLLDHVVSQVG